MSSDYVPKQVRPTGNTDTNGNMGFNVVFSSGDSVFLLAKKAPEVGVTEYGEIVDATSKAGKSYKRFYRRQREEWTGSPATFGGDIQPGGFVALPIAPDRLESLEKRVKALEVMFGQETPQIASQSLVETPKRVSAMTTEEIEDWM